MMKVLIVASEVAPIVKLGGLGDVIGSLPKALEKIGVNADVIVPLFDNVRMEGLSVYKSLELNVPFGGENNVVEVFKTKLPHSNVDVFLLKNYKYFSKGGKDAFANNLSETEMFTFFDMAVVEYVKSEFNTYDLIHCNDWHTGLITHLLQDELGKERPATLFTIHNLLYQGKGGVDLIRDVGIYPGEHRLIDWDISDGDINLILQGITSSDYVNAVSPTYAREIVTREFGKELSDVIKNREGRLTGILNGVDYSQFPRNYDAGNYSLAKKDYKEQTQKELKLEKSGKPMFAFISRLDANQKGLDILLKVVSEIVKNGGQFVLLGTGDKEWEKKFADLSEEADVRGNVSVNLKFDVSLADQIYAASDFLLVPSKYEPCGLIQMIGMWYGSLPIVHAVGGLKDSVTEGVNGFTFDSYSSGRLLSAIQKALKVYGTHLMDTMIVNAMKTDFSWDKSALEYKHLYEKVVKLHEENFS